MLGKGMLDYPANEPSLYVLARHINDFMPTHMFRLTRDALQRARSAVKRCQGCSSWVGFFGKLG